MRALACGEHERQGALVLTGELEGAAPGEQALDVADGGGAAGVRLGGVLGEQGRRVDAGLRVRQLGGCFCVLYASDQFNNPAQEAERGNVQILETSRQDDGYVDFYTCACLHCGARYHVTEREYHYTWWGWSRI